MFYSVSYLYQGDFFLSLVWDDKFKEDSYYLVLLKWSLASSKEEFGELGLKKAILPMF